MKKKMSIILVIALLVTSVLAGVPFTSVDAAGVTLPAGYEFIDTCYSPELGAYLAMAKNFTVDKQSPAEIYRSTDGFIWTKVYGPVNAYNSANPRVNQNLVWWPEGKIFAAAFSGLLYTSPNGVVWTLRDNAGISNMVLEVNAGKLMISGGNKVRVFNTLSNPVDTTDYSEFAFDSGQNAKTVGLSNTNPIKYSITDRYITWGKVGDNNVTKAYPDLGAHPFDMTYLSKLDKWIVINGQPSLRILTHPASYSTNNAVKLSDNTTNTSLFSASSASNDYIITGTADGKIYFIPHTTTAPTVNTAWNIAINGSDATPITGKITSITPVSNEKFLFATTSSLYFLEKSGEDFVYSSIDTYKNITDIKFSQNPFYGVALTEIAYSPTLNMYAAAGLEGTKGSVFTSTDGFNWQKANAPTVPIAAIAGQSMVWWPKEQMFVIMGNGDSSFIYSKDGVSWSWGNKAASMFKGGITVQGEDLYMAGGKVVRKYTGFNSADNSFTYEDKTVSSVSGDFFNRIGVSSDQNPTIMATYQYYGNIGALSQETWTRLSSIGGYGNITDIVYSNVSGKFFVTSENSYGNSNSLVTAGKDGTVTNITAPLISDAAKKTYCHYNRRHKFCFRCQRR